MPAKDENPYPQFSEDATEADMRAVLGDDVFEELAEAGRRAVNAGLSAHASGAKSVAEYRAMIKA